MRWINAEGSVSIWTYRLAVAIGLLLVAGVSALPGAEGWCSAVAVREAVPTEAVSCADFWLNRYQTLLAGLLAVTGAFMTVRVVRQQISQVDRLEYLRRASESYAARAVLPLALSSITRYAETCVKLLVGFTGERTYFTERGIPAIPDNLINPLRECIRFSNESQAKQIADLLAQLQIQNSRLHSLARRPDDIVEDYWVHQLVHDAAELYVLASDLFDYGRRAEEGKRGPISTDRIRGALMNCGVWDGMYPKLDRWLELQDKSNT